MLLIFLSGFGTESAAGYINLSSLIGELWPPLGASGPSDAVFWTDSELYEWADEAAKRLARDCGVFTEFNSSLAAVQSQGSYSLPARHISTLQADLNGTVLKPRTVQQLEAYDVDWPTAEDTPVSFVQDTQGVEKLTTYPAPDALSAGQTIGLIRHVYPATVTATNGILVAPACAAELFRFAILAEARSKESKAQMPEAAGWYRQQARLVESVLQDYFGKAQ